MEKRYAKGKYPIYYDQNNEVKSILEKSFEIQNIGEPPTTLIVDKEGIVRYAHLGDASDDIPANEEIFMALQDL